MSNQERIAELEECLAWLKAKTERERNHLAYRARKDIRTATDEIGENDLVMEGKLRAILERMIAVNKSKESEDSSNEH